MDTGASPGQGGICLPISRSFVVGQACPLLWSGNKWERQLGKILSVFMSQVPENRIPVLAPYAMSTSEQRWLRLGQRKDWGNSQSLHR